jgi:hypothetical protein
LGGDFLFRKSRWVRGDSSKFAVRARFCSVLLAIFESNQQAGMELSAFASVWASISLLFAVLCTPQRIRDAEQCVDMLVCVGEGTNTSTPQAVRD